MLQNEGVIEWFYYKSNTNIYRNTGNIADHTEPNVKRPKQKRQTQQECRQGKKRKHFLKQEVTALLLTVIKQKVLLLRFIFRLHFM